MTMTNVIIGEFVGTILLVLLGDGVCANVTLNNSGFKAAGALFIGVLQFVFQQQHSAAFVQHPITLHLQSLCTQTDH
jgi:glycerol uptake facilitator-like aquaporin